LHSAPAGSNAQESLYQAALGPVHAEHYLPVFARFDERGANGPAWNTAAALGSLAWLVYRQLWGAAGEFIAALTAWALIAAGLVFWADFLPIGVRVGLALVLLLLLLLVPGLYGTALLHAQIRRRMIAAVQQAATMDEACTLLRWQGDAHRHRGAWSVAGLLLIAGVLAGALWLAAPTMFVSPAAMSNPLLVADQGASAPALMSAPGDTQHAAVPVTISEALTAPEAAAALRPEPAVAQTAAVSETKPILAALGDASPLAAPAVEPPVAEVVTRVKGYGVSVGLFAVAANAERAQSQLSAAGLPVLSDPIESARGPLTRVRVGPFDSREQAQAAAKRVRSLGLDARVYAP
jgi:cell division septation protein DedD